MLNEFWRSINIEWWMEGWIVKLKNIVFLGLLIPLFLSRRTSIISFNLNLFPPHRSFNNSRPQLKCVMRKPRGSTEPQFISPLALYLDFSLPEPWTLNLDLSQAEPWSWVNISLNLEPGFISNFTLNLCLSLTESLTWIYFYLNL